MIKQFKRFYPQIRLVEVYTTNEKFGLTYLSLSSDGCELSRCCCPNITCRLCSHLLRFSL